MIKRIRKTVTETKENGRGGQTNFEPQDIKIWRCKIHESCNRCVDVTVGTDPTLRAETGDKIIVGDVERIRGSIT